MQVMDDLNNRPVGDRFYSKKVATIATSVDKFQDRNYNSPPKSPRVEIMEVAKANKVWKENQVVLLIISSMCMTFNLCTLKSQNTICNCENLYDITMMWWIWTVFSEKEESKF